MMNRPVCSASVTQGEDEKYSVSLECPDGPIGLPFPVSLIVAFAVEYMTTQLGIDDPERQGAFVANMLMEIQRSSFTLSVDRHISKLATATDRIAFAQSFAASVTKETQMLVDLIAQAGGRAGNNIQ